MITNEASARAWLREGLGCDDVTIARLESFVLELTQENARQNLVSSGSLENVWVRHIADSAQLLNVSRGTGGVWLDLGTGAGFPGLVTALLEPRREFVLVESRSLRAQWLRKCVAALACENITVIESRLERVSTFAASTISARAFAPLSTLLGLAGRFSTPDSEWLLPKGKNAARELAEMPQAYRSMFHVEPSLTAGGAAILVGRGVPSAAARGS